VEILPGMLLLSNFAEMLIQATAQYVPLQPDSAETAMDPAEASSATA